MKTVHFSLSTSVFYGFNTPEEGSVEGYASIINTYNLEVPILKLSHQLHIKLSHGKVIGDCILSSKHISNPDV